MYNKHTQNICYPWLDFDVFYLDAAYLLLDYKMKLVSVFDQKVNECVSKFGVLFVTLTFFDLSLNFN